MKLQIVFGILTMLTLTACGNNKVGTGGSTGNTISGTITAPAGQTVTGTTVVFCVEQNNTPNCLDANSKLITITASGSSATFTSPELLITKLYTVRAAKDLDGDGKASFGDLFDNGQSSIQPPKTGVNLSLRVDD
jgi:hypothetical protein